ncbi:MAG: sugar ABC transporter ATP-binding protein [Dongiaceae bacterium]
MMADSRQATRNELSEVVILEGISKRFGNTQAVKNVSLMFKAGEVHAILGENGAGKSTVGKIMGGLVQPDAGKLFLDGKETRLRNVAGARGLGFSMVFQELSLVPDLTVRENIYLGMESARHPFGLVQRKSEEERCRALFAEYNFDFDLNDRARSHSVANQQLIEVVKALSCEPRVLILDEPTAMLGVRENEKLLGIIRSARSRGVAVIFITHHAEEVVKVADRVSLMKDGVLVESFVMTEEMDAPFIVAKLAGRSGAACARKQAPSLGPEVFAIHNLSGRREKSADVSVSAGQVVGLYGVVGSGCERIGRAAVGLADIRPSTMALAGRNYRPGSPAYAARKGVSYLPSGRAANCVLPSRSARENLMISQLDQVQSYGIINDGVEREMTQSLLARFRTRYADYDDAITSLSGGNQQKVMIARCLGRASKLIVLEDPTAGVDIGSKQDIHELVRERAAAGLAVLLISSDLLETIAISDVIYTVIRDQIIRKYENPTIEDEANIIADVLGG